MKDPVIVNKAVDDSIRYHEQRTGDDGLKSLETRIANANNDVEQLTNSFIMAKNDLLRTTIEKKMNELEIYIADLNKQKSQIKIERSLKVTKEQILEFIAELVKGDTNDKGFQKRIIDRLVNKVYISDGSFFAMPTFFDIVQTEHITFDDVQETTASVIGVQSSTPQVYQIRLSLF